MIYIQNKKKKIMKKKLSLFNDLVMLNLNYYLKIFIIMTIL